MCEQTQARCAADEERTDGDLVADGAWPHVDQAVAARSGIVDHDEFGAGLFGLSTLTPNSQVPRLMTAAFPVNVPAGQGLQPRTLAGFATIAGRYGYTKICPRRGSVPPKLAVE